jgi:hypothetical protein
MVGLETPRLYWFRLKAVLYVQFRKVFYMPTGVYSRGYKLRLREGKSPKSLCMDESSRCSFSG